MKKNIRTQKPSLVLLIALVGFPQISETIFTPSLPDIAEGLGVSMGMVQLTMSIYFFAFAFGVFFWGWLSDRYGRRPAMLYGLLVYGLGCYLCYQAQNLNYLLLGRFIQAFGASTGSITTQTILRESYQGTERHQVFAKISAALAFTPAIGPFIGGIVGEYYGFTMVFLSLVIASLVLFISSYYYLPETQVINKSQPIQLGKLFKELISDPKVMTYGFLIGALNGIIFSYYAEGPFIFTEYFGMSLSQYGLLGIIVALATIIGSLTSNRLLSSQKAEKIISLGIKILLIGVLIILSVAITANLGSFSQITGLLIGVFIMLIGIGMALPNCLSLALVNYQEVIGSAGAIFSLGYYFLVSGITLGMSLLHTGSLQVMPWYFLVIGLLMLWLTNKNILK